jgi:hypothetical protein
MVTVIVLSENKIVLLEQLFDILIHNCEPSVSESGPCFTIFTKDRDYKNVRMYNQV